MPKIFDEITGYVNRQYSTFDMGNNWIGSVTDFGSLNTIYQSVVLAGDKWKLGHNLMVKLPPLVAPAFTRIKGIVNSFYCSYASVWNYWNSFISDRPEDAFLGRSVAAAYKGKFVEPCCETAFLALICKVAKGWFVWKDDVRGFLTKVTSDSSQGNSPYYFKLDVALVQQNNVANTTGFTSPCTITWTLDKFGYRKAQITQNFTISDGLVPPLTPWRLEEVHEGKHVFQFPAWKVNGVAESLGFSDMLSYFIYQCQSVCKNLSNHGFPIEEMCKSSLFYYKNGQSYINLLPFMCESSAWQNYYRDQQNQSPELDYREVNGVISDFISDGDGMPYGWNLRLIGVPPSESTGNNYWFKVLSQSDALSVLTGFLLEESVRYQFQGASDSNIVILPKFYNGLLCLKFRNFERDYFTSASIDPNYGGVSVEVPSTIDALRTASKLEEFLEVSSTAQDFYHFMMRLFGTNPESTRYNRPLLLGTDIVPVQIGEQLQTSESTSSSPLGERAGVADGSGRGGTVNHYFNEHGHVWSWLSFVIDSQYMQGLPHEFNHHLQFDYPFPQFANLSAEAIPLREIYFAESFAISPYAPAGVDYSTGDNNAMVGREFTKNTVGDSSEMDVQGFDEDVPVVENGLGIKSGYGIPVSGGSSCNIAKVSTVGTLDFLEQNVFSTFGYTPRYSKWKFKQDVVAGQMRDSLEYWHTFRSFSSTPYISNAFVSYMNAGFLSNLNRIFAVENDNADKFFVDVFNNATVRRALPLVPNTTLD